MQIGISRILCVGVHVFVFPQALFDIPIVNEAPAPCKLLASGYLGYGWNTVILPLLELFACEKGQMLQYSMPNTSA